MSSENNTKPRQAEDEAPLEPDPVIEYYKQFVDRDLLRANLKLSVEERLQNLQIVTVFAQKLAIRLERNLGLPHRPLAKSSF